MGFKITDIPSNVLPAVSPVIGKISTGDVTSIAQFFVETKFLQIEYLHTNIVLN